MKYNSINTLFKTHFTQSKSFYFLFFFAEENGKFLKHLTERTSTLITYFCF